MKFTGIPPLGNLFGLFIGAEAFFELKRSGLKRSIINFFNNLTDDSFFVLKTFFCDMTVNS